MAARRRVWPFALFVACALQVNERLAGASGDDSAASQFEEFAKVQWPTRAACTDCRELSMPPRSGVKPSLKWRYDAVLRALFEQYCLEPRFECWEVAAKRLPSNQTRPDAC